jgi:hypothetical protein
MISTVPTTNQGNVLPCGGGGGGGGAFLIKIKPMFYFLVKKRFTQKIHNRVKN